MSSKRILTEIFLPEATLEFPDSEIAAVTRMIQSATRAGRLPRDAAENWPIASGPARRQQASAPTSPTTPAAPTKPTVKAPVTPAQAKPASNSVQTSSGRSFPSTNRFVQGTSPAVAPATPTSNTKSKPKVKPKSASAGVDTPTKPGLIKRAAAAIKGVDPTTGYKTAKSANFKVPGNHGPANNLPRLGNFFPGSSSAQGSTDKDDPLADYPNKEPVPANEPTGFEDDSKTDPEYVSPFRGIPGLDTSKDDERSGDPIDRLKTKHIKRAFAAARSKTDGPTPKPKPDEFPNAKAWDSLGNGDKGADEPPQKKKQQGRLSKLFKGRRDDDI